MKTKLLGFAVMLFILCGSKCEHTHLTPLLDNGCKEFEDRTRGICWLQCKEITRSGREVLTSRDIDCPRRRHRHRK